jgi:mercuric ion transport protein
MEKPRTWSWLLIFTTSGTLLCCALPITLVTLGLGASAATMASAAPWIITLSQYKAWVFLASATLIGLSFWAVTRAGRVCPTDPELAAACNRADRWNRRFIGVSVTMWLVGFLAAFGLPLLLRLSA